jgi:ATP-dependent DNA ligase
VIFKGPGRPVWLGPHQRETLHIAGFAMKENKFDGLYVGRQMGRDLIYACKVDKGFDSSTAKDLQARLKPLVRKTQPYTKKIAHRGIWIEPSLLAEIEYRTKPAEGKVRHPLFKVYSGGSAMGVRRSTNLGCALAPILSPQRNNREKTATFMHAGWNRAVGFAVV